LEENGIAASRFGIITISDTRTEQDDVSGAAAEEALLALGAIQIERTIVRDDAEDIKEALLDMCSRCDAVLTTGGTGFGPRDVTPEATASILDKRADSLAERLRTDGRTSTELSHLSRGIAGMRGSTLIVNMPGAPGAVTDGIRSLAPLLPHVLRMLRGDTAHIAQ
jgi:molybdenum cofactor synthesis domain-containing protein